MAEHIAHLEWTRGKGWRNPCQGRGMDWTDRPSRCTRTEARHLPVITCPDCQHRYKPRWVLGPEFVDSPDPVGVIAWDCPMELCSYDGKPRH